MNYTLLNRNVPVLDFSYDENCHEVKRIISLLNPEFAPVGIQESGTGISKSLFNDWWKNRAIPLTRSNIMELLRDLNLDSPVALLEKSFGLSLSDQYWIRPEGSDLAWEDINFFHHDFSEDIGLYLMGQIPASEDLDMMSPDNSCGGNLKKKWIIADGKRILLKAGSGPLMQEPFNEVIASALYKRVLQPEDYVPYEILEENHVFYSACPVLITEEEEIVAALYIDRQIEQKANDNLYDHYIRACESLRIPDARLKTDQMIVCDYILGNYDRHYRNFGAIRNVRTLEWKGICPIFDNGSSLWTNQPDPLIGSSYPAKPFYSNPERQLACVKDFSWLDLEKLEGFDEEAAWILSQNPYLSENRIKAIQEQIQNRIRRVADKVQDHNDR